VAPSGNPVIADRLPPPRPELILVPMRMERVTDAGGPRYARVALPIPLDKTFTYEIPRDLAGGAFVGRRVSVPFGGRALSGVIVGLANNADIPPSRIKRIERLQETFLPPELLRLSDWIAAYYGCSRGESMQSVLPPSFRRARVRARHVGLVCVTDRLLVQDREAFESVARTLGRATRQLGLFRMLVESGGEAPVETVTEEWAISRPVLDGLIQRGLVHVRRVDSVSPLDEMEKRVEKLTDAQQSALEKIQRGMVAGGFRPSLLYGVTGSGKTEVYLRAAREVVDQGGGCIVLVPEIGLLPQAGARYRRMFGEDVAIIHSRLTGPERYAVWEKIESGRYRVVVGPRSAVFSPVRDLRLIVVDEEQDDSYKQDDKPRYHARNVALIRARDVGASVVLGSATPSAESLRQANEGTYDLLRLPERVSGAPMPGIEIVDMRRSDGKRTLFSQALITALEDNIEAGNQSIVFLNKRGHARFVQCNSCGWVATCKHCDISLTYHRVDNRLKCHFCGYARAAVSRCDDCKSPRLFYSGVGTQRVELDLQALFPGVGVLRMDADTTSGKEGHRRVLERFSTGRFPILLGTQMVVKGHHFPGVNLVGVLYAEEGLNFPDFRSAERTFQQLTQVSGRSGRGSEPGRVMVQTYMPDHYVFRYLVSHDYDGFMAEELEFRRKLGYPPFARLVLASCSSRDPDKLHIFMEEWTSTIRRALSARRIDVLGPTPPVVARVKSRYREQVLIKGGLNQADKDGILASYREIVDRRKLSRTIELRWDVDPETFF
jgi:primosomal protein N' (replication factor Y)